MKYTKKSNVRLVRSAAAIFWMGFFMAISFMEAPLKFMAPGVSMAQGLQIGKIVFGTLNICEWAFLATMVITCFIQKPGTTEGRLVTIAALILALETFWLLPVLGADADRIIHGQAVAGHNLHGCYVVLELVKAPVLLLAGIAGVRNLFKHAAIPAAPNPMTIA